MMLLKSIPNTRHFFKRDLHPLLDIVSHECFGLILKCKRKLVPEVSLEGDQKSINQTRNSKNTGLSEQCHRIVIILAKKTTIRQKFGVPRRKYIVLLVTLERTTTFQICQKLILLAAELSHKMQYFQV